MTHVYPLYLSLCLCRCPFCPQLPPLAFRPLMSTPNVLLSTHCTPSKSPRVKAAAVKVKLHLFPSLFVLGCHYAGCDHATKFSSKIPQPSLLSVSLGRCTPRQCLLSLNVPHFCQWTCSPIMLLSLPSLLNPLFRFFSRTLAGPVCATLSHNLYCFKFLQPQPPPSLFHHIYFASPLLPSHLFPSLLSLIFWLYLFSELSCFHLFFSVA